MLIKRIKYINYTNLIDCAILSMSKIMIMECTQNLHFIGKIRCCCSKMELKQNK